METTYEIVKLKPIQVCSGEWAKFFVKSDEKDTYILTNNIKVGDIALIRRKNFKMLGLIKDVSDTKVKFLKGDGYTEDDYLYLANREEVMSIVATTNSSILIDSSLDEQKTQGCVDRINLPEIKI